MVVLKLKIDNQFVHLRIFDEKNECIAEIQGKSKDHKEALSEIGKAYSKSLNPLRDLIFFLENPRSITEGLKIGYEYTKDR